MQVPHPQPLRRPAERVEPLVAALAVAVISSGSAIVVGLVGAWVAKRKGLPGINAEIEQRMQQLVDTLRSELTERTNDLAAKVSELQACRTELFSVKRDLRNTEFELLSLYRSTGQKPPSRLEGTGR